MFWLFGYTKQRRHGSESKKECIKGLNETTNGREWESERSEGEGLVFIVWSLGFGVCGLWLCAIRKFGEGSGEGKRRELRLLLRH
jgi:hypothetical protein